MMLKLRSGTAQTDAWELRARQAIPIDSRYVIALDQVGSILKHFDGCHWDISSVGPLPEIV